MVSPSKRKTRTAQPGKGGKRERIFSASFPSSPTAIEPTVAHVLRSVSHQAHMDGRHGEIELALREALANAILHGNGGNRRKRVRVECYRVADGLVLVVRDSGKGFDPDKVEDPTRPENLLRDRGRGIFLIRHFMDEVQFARGGREIRMRKNL